MLLEAIGVENVILKVEMPDAVECGAAGTSHGVGEKAGCAAIFGREVVGGDAVFLNSLRRQGSKWPCNEVVVVFYAIEQKIGGRRPLPVDGKPKSPRSAGIGGDSRLGDQHRVYVTPLKGERLDLIGGNHLREG